VAVIVNKSNGLRSWGEGLYQRWSFHLTSAVGQTTPGFMEKRKSGWAECALLWWFMDGAAGRRPTGKKTQTWTFAFFFYLSATGRGLPLPL
jgi:hypothetical protein